MDKIKPCATRAWRRREAGQLFIYRNSFFFTWIKQNSERWRGVFFCFAEPGRVCSGTCSTYPNAGAVALEAAAETFNRVQTAFFLLTPYQ